MGDNDDGAAVGAVDILHEPQDFHGCLVVERAGGLVAQQQARIFDECTADGAALLLAARDLARELVAVLVKTQRTQQVVDIERVFGQVRRDLDVLLDGEVGHQVVELEDKAQLTASVFAQVSGLEHREVAAVHQNRAGIGILQAADQVEEGRLTRARGPQHDADLAAVDGRVDAIEYRQARITVAIVLFEILNLDVGFLRCHGIPHC